MPYNILVENNLSSDSPSLFSAINKSEKFKIVHNGKPDLILNHGAGEVSPLFLYESPRYQSSVSDYEIKDVRFGTVILSSRVACVPIVNIGRPAQVALNLSGGLLVDKPYTSSSPAVTECITKGEDIFKGLNFTIPNTIRKMPMSDDLYDIYYNDRSGNASIGISKKRKTMDMFFSPAIYGLNAGQVSDKIVEAIDRFLNFVKGN